MADRKNINPYIPKEDDFCISKIQSYLAEDVYVDLVGGEWKHRRRKVVNEESVVEVDFPDGSMTKLRVLGDYGKENGYHDGF